MTEILETVWQIAKSPFADKSSKRPLKIRFALFFDGTNNNASNIKEREKFENNQKSDSNAFQLLANGNDTSYDNGFTNIAIMEPNAIPKSDGYNCVFKIYIEGQGTFNLGTDSSMGLGMATNTSGVWMRARQGLTKALETLDEFFEKYKPDEYTIEKIDIDVFGFSRGAATARHCIHVIHGKDFSDAVTLLISPALAVAGAVVSALQSPEEVIVPAFYKRIFWRGFIDITEDKVNVKFAGLYDTVVSVMASQVGPTWLMGNIRDQRAVAKAKASLHLAAAEEHRKDFPLHTINSAKVAGTGEEYYLPGVHSDVGGSYNLANTTLLDQKKEDATIRKVLNTGYYNDMAKEYNELISKGAYKPADLDLVITERGTGRGAANAPLKGMVVAKRKISGLEYARTGNEGNRIINRDLIKNLIIDMGNLIEAGWYSAPVERNFYLRKGDLIYKYPVIDGVRVQHPGVVVQDIPDEIYILITQWTGVGRGRGVPTPYNGLLVVNRIGIKSAYCNIPLKIMATYAKKNGIKIDPKLEDRANKTLENEPELLQLEGVINSYIGQYPRTKSTPEHWLDPKGPVLKAHGKLIKKVRHDHLHMSCRWNESKALLNILDPGFTPELHDNIRKRAYYEG